MNQLPVQQKQVIELKIWDNLPDEEIEKSNNILNKTLKK
jgi:hypothetical protein